MSIPASSRFTGRCPMARRSAMPWALARAICTNPAHSTFAARPSGPRWTPTPAMIKREPHIYKRHAGGMDGGGENPLGARALYLYSGNRDTYLRIHGTPKPQTIAARVSNGCVRMINEHVIDLYDRVPNGTRVVLH